MQTYLDRALPFGLRSAPKLFSAVADALAWGMRRRGIQYQLHYLDDYLLLGPPGTPVCVQAMSTTWSFVNFLESQWQWRRYKVHQLHWSSWGSRLISSAIEITAKQTGQVTVSHRRMGGMPFVQKTPTLGSLQPRSNGGTPRSDITPSHNWLCVTGGASRPFHLTE